VRGGAAPLDFTDRYGKARTKGGGKKRCFHGPDRADAQPQRRKKGEEKRESWMDLWAGIRRLPEWEGEGNPTGSIFLIRGRGATGEVSKDHYHHYKEERPRRKIYGGLHWKKKGHSPAYQRARPLEKAFWKPAGNILSLVDRKEWRPGHT